MKKKLLLLIVLFLSAGCAKTVSFNISENYAIKNPASVIVMPVIMKDMPEEEKTQISNLFRATVQEKLHEKHYATIPVEKVDKELSSKGLLKEGKLPAPQLVAPLFKSDAVLYTRITKWNEDSVVTYASLKIAAEFLLYSTNGDLLWEGSFSTKESDFRMDKDATELGILKAYEPRIQRIVDAVFLKLPQPRIRSKKQDFFKWLP